ncbi:MAG TPA: SEC-C metal-binding domain-containing protein [Polyangiaceae bacterium]|nr:SEC-C metal-binding domain-containing protein [Polyangiaceae bacterium]
MANRIFRLSLSPDDAPEVRRVIDFDGRHTLHDVHWMLQDTLLADGDDDHLYAFFLSGKYWDKSARYFDPRSDGPRADQALLFRLKLRIGQRFVYVYDFGTERRFSLTVVAITETDAPLASPVLVESVGDAPRQLDYDEEYPGDEAETDNPALQALFELAQAVVDQIQALDALSEDASSEEALPVLRQLAETTLALLLEIAGDLRLFWQIDREFDLAGAWLDLPARLSLAGETELAVRVAEALKFCAPDQMNGEIALSYARSGDRERALARVLTNLETATEPFIAEYEAGDVYRELGEVDAAEAYYRRSLALAETASDRREAALRITTLLIDSGREADASAFVTQLRAAEDPEPDPPESVNATLPSVGRNDPCPCGSGKKYKKCHGA